ncbi:unnamed protein product [Urochloa humidicola]
MEERFAVTAATGALGPVLMKLTALLGDESKLHHEGTRRDIVSIKSMLEPVHDLLAMLWGREDLHVACKDWMTEARELSYDLDDNIDLCFIQPEPQAMDDSPFKEFMERVNGVSKRCSEMQKIGDAIICNHNKLSTDPRALFLHKDASELVGMEEKEEELMRLLQEHGMVCIVGFAGMGKTTLADLVYQSIGDEFHCRAFVSVHLNPNMMEILGTILSQVTNGAMSTGSGTELASEESIIDEISSFLSDKRYLIIIDDIWHWEEWVAVRKALPENNLGNKIVMTTRINTIAERCQSEESAHVYKQNFQYEDAERLSYKILKKSVEGDGILEANMKVLSTKIVLMCGTIPLAIISLSSALAESQVQGDYGEWDAWVSHVLDRFLSTPCLKPLVQSLCLGLDDLPVHLRTCLLYCSIYPPEYLIERDCLVRKWMAERFVWQQDVAEAYFDMLVSRNLLQPVRLWLFKNTCYAVPPIMLAFLACKAKEDNFLDCRQYNGPGSSSHAKQIRRVFIHTGLYGDDDVSHTHTLAVLGRQSRLAPYEKFKNLRVLEIESKSTGNDHLVDICGLVWLRYLGLKGATITELPREIGRLQNLETLDIRRAHVTKLPLEIEKLQHLEAINISNTKVTELPREIWKLQNLETLIAAETRLAEIPTEIELLQHLKTLDVSDTEVTKIPTEIEKLHNLRNLNISGTKVTELPKGIEKLQHLRTLNISATKVAEVPKKIEKLQHLEYLNISNTGVKELPKGIGKLQHLCTLDIRKTKVTELLISYEVSDSLLSVVAGSIGSAEVVKLPPCVSSINGVEEVISSCQAKCREDLSILILFNHIGSWCEVLPVPMLRLAQKQMSVPLWVKQHLCNVSSLDIRLCKLGYDDLEFLEKMPNLQALELRLEVLPREPVTITGGGFSKLETFYVDCRMPRVTFQRGAMPKLKHLEFKFYTGTTSQDYSIGIKNLDSLKKVVFRCSEYYTSNNPGIRATIEVVRKEAAEHPNEITFYVNDMKPEVFDSGTKWISQEDRAIVENEFEQWEKEIKERERIVAERAESIREQRHQLFTAAEERRKQRGKSNARAAIEKEMQERKSMLEKREQRLRERARWLL